MSFHHRSQFEGKPKFHKHKGKSKPSAQGKPQGRVPDAPEKSKHRAFQHASQWRDVGQAQRHATAVERRKQHTEKRVKEQIRYLRHIQGGVPKIIALIPFSRSSQCTRVKQKILQYCGIDSKENAKANPIFITSTIGNRKVNFILWVCPRNTTSVIDITKIADIVLLVSSPSKEFFENNYMQRKKQNKRLDNSYNDISGTYQNQLLGVDKKSKLFCNILRGQGVANLMGLYHPRFKTLSGDINPESPAHSKIQCKVTNEVVNNFNKLINFEFGANAEKQFHWRVLHAYDMVQLFRFLDTCPYSDIEWREKRNYLLGENIIFEQNENDSTRGTLLVSGFLRGKRPFDINLPVHITGLGDFLVDKVEEISVTLPKKLPMLPSERRSLRKEERSVRDAKSSPGTPLQGPLESPMNDVEPSQNIEFFEFLDNDAAMKENENILEDISSQEPKQPQSQKIVNKDVAMIDHKNEKNNKENSNHPQYTVLAQADNTAQTSMELLRTLDDLATAMDQSVITEEELKEADERRRQVGAKAGERKGPKKGFTDHRDAWEETLGWSYGQESSDEEEEEEDMKDPLRDIIAETQALRISEEEKNNPIEMMARQKALERKEQQNRDEVDTPLHMRAKDKFAQYRGLKQFARVKWDKFELLPVEYSRIHNISDWKLAKKQSKINDKLIENGVFDYGVQTGRKIRLHIRNVPASASDLWVHSDKYPTLVWGLLEHEHKISVCHYLIKKSSTYDAPVQGLQNYVFDCGYRRLKARPVFSENSRFDKHLVTKFISDTDHSVASFYAPIAYPPLPVLMFEDPRSPLVKQRRDMANKNNGDEDNKDNDNDDDEDDENDDDEDDDVDPEIKMRNQVEKNWKDDLDMYDMDNEATRNFLEEDSKQIKDPRKGILRIHRECDLCATGNLLEVNAHRLLIKRKILTGTAFRVHQRRAIVRYMFWNKEDIEYFKPLDLWTKGGKTGKIEEPLGEKGLMKCFFDDTISQNDTVCLSLYKRIFPVADPAIFGPIVLKKTEKEKDKIES